MSENIMGRPPIFKSPKDMQDLINDYFNSVEKETDLTITGLVLHLGFESRQSFYDYEKKENYSYTIRTARLRIENSYEKSLRKDGRTGDIFALKNFGWKDKSEIDLNTNSEPDSTFEIVKANADS